MTTPATPKVRVVSPRTSSFPSTPLIDQVHLLAGLLDTFTVVDPQLQALDFRRSATTFAIPMFFVEGAHEAGGRAKPLAAWYPMIEAPTKDLIVFDGSGHRPL